MPFALKNQMTELTSQSVELVIDMVRYEVLLQSTQLSQWLSKQWERGRRNDDSSRPSKTSGQ
jgi:hypothetical protein